MTHEQFLSRVSKNNKHYRDGKITIVGTFRGIRENISVVTSLGKHELMARGIMEGKMPSTSSLIDPLTHLHSRLLEESEHYKDGKYKLDSIDGHYVIVSTQYGLCRKRRDGLLEGNMPTIKAAIDKDTFLKNKLIHRVEADYDFTAVKYGTAKNHKVIVKCKVHGIFTQRIDALLAQTGCPRCGQARSTEHNSRNPTGWKYSDWIEGGLRSENFDGFKVYVIRCWNDEEEFYKIGKTFTTVEWRFHSNFRMPYNYEVVTIFPGEARETCELEDVLKAENTKYRYQPLKYFSGHKECYSTLNFNSQFANHE